MGFLAEGRGVEMGWWGRHGGRLFVGVFGVVVAGTVNVEFSCVDFGVEKLFGGATREEGVFRVQ